MKISAKGRYGLAAMTYLALNYASGAPVTIISISEKLCIQRSTRPTRPTTSHPTL